LRDCPVMRGGRINEALRWGFEFSHSKRRTRQDHSLRLRLRSSLRQSGSRFAMAFYGTRERVPFPVHGCSSGRLAVCPSALWLSSARFEGVPFPVHGLFFGASDGVPFRFIAHAMRTHEWGIRLRLLGMTHLPNENKWSLLKVLRMTHFPK
jgi:hypothetical protein